MAPLPTMGRQEIPIGTATLETSMPNEFNNSAREEVMVDVVLSQHWSVPVVHWLEVDVVATEVATRARRVVATADLANMMKDESG